MCGQNLAIGRGRGREEIRRRIREGEFPDTRGLVVLGDVIHKCWRVGFKTMGEVRDAIEEERKGHITTADGEEGLGPGEAALAGSTNGS